jgi:hypothetical protein
MRVILTAGGACSDEQFRAHARRRPLPPPSRKGGLGQKLLDSKDEGREKGYLTNHNL